MCDNCVNVANSDQRDGNKNTPQGYACEPAAPGCEWKLVEQPIYGIQREGVSVPDGITLSTVPSDTIYTRKVGQKLYELDDQLGNARVIISDRKLSDIVSGVPGKFRAEVKSYTNVYPFGMEEPGRYMNGDAYQYGYNGMEQDSAISDDQYTTYFRMYDARLGRWLSIDPVDHVGESPYVAMGDNPVVNVDPNGDADTTYQSKDGKKFGATITDDQGQKHEYTWVEDESHKQGGFYKQLRDPSQSAEVHSWTDDAAVWFADNIAIPGAKFTFGFVEAFTEDMTFGASAAPEHHRFDYWYRSGRVGGHAGAILFGEGEVGGGADMIVGGAIATPETGPVGVGIAVGGGALIGHGFGVMITSAKNLGKDLQNFNLADNASSSGPSKRGEPNYNRKFSPKEEAVADYLKGRGHTVEPNPWEGVEGAGRQGDAIVDGVMHEFKTLDPGATLNTMKNTLNESLSGMGQAREVVFDARLSGLTEEQAKQSAFKALGIARGKLDGLTVIGNDYFFKYLPRVKNAVP